MKSVTRLYETFKPNEYRLSLTLNRVARQFNGSVSILGDFVGHGTLHLHAKDLNIISVRCGDKLMPFRLGEEDQLIITDSEPPGPRHLTIEFSGTITDAMHGLYPCYYEIAGVKKELLATQFESHHAREVFPCVDEPEAKAVFHLTLTTEPGIEVLSNMPARTVTAAGDAITTMFEPTPMMSPYLLAFVVGELHKQSKKTKSGVEVNVWATRAQPAERLLFPLEVAIRTIDFFDEYFGVSYPLPKADHVALPDFSAGAMENWGLITYREIALLVDTSSSLSAKEYVATVIAHETSHQWFGNLVTMRWWDDLWLNESFATIMEYVAIDALYPEWQTWQTFASQETLSALRRDQLAGVQAVKSEVNHPDEISTLFDPSIVYAKGARLLKMLRHYIGEDDFRNGLRKYFDEYAYKNTVGADLWQSFTATSGKNIENFMQAWITQPGFPLVTLSHVEDGYSLSQERFVLGEISDHSLWPIPLFTTNEVLPELLDVKEMTIHAKTSQTILNKGNEAHFITKYDHVSLSHIIASLEAGQLQTIDRLSLLHETSLLARGGKVDTASLVPLLYSYKNEDIEPVWNIIGMVIDELKRFVEEYPSSEARLKQFVRRIAGPLHEKLGFDVVTGEPEQDTKLRATILGLLAYAENEGVIATAFESFHGADDITHLPSETRAVVYGIVAKHGTKDDFELLLSQHTTTTNAEVRDDLTSGLCMTTNTNQVHILLDRLTQAELVKQQDVFRWFLNLLRNRHAREVTWSWMIQNWPWIKKTFSGDKSYENYARHSASIFATRGWLERYIEFFEPMRTITALTRAIDVGRTEMESRVEWIERDGPAVRATIENDETYL